MFFALRRIFFPTSSRHLRHAFPALEKFLRRSVWRSSALFLSAVWSRISITSPPSFRSCIRTQLRRFQTSEDVRKRLHSRFHFLCQRTGHEKKRQAIDSAERNENANVLRRELSQNQRFNLKGSLDMVDRRNPLVVSTLQQSTGGRQALRRQGKAPVVRG